MRLGVFIASSLVLTGAAVWAPAQSSTASTATLTLTEKTEVPGFSLSPGTYRLRVEDQLRDRMVIEVEKDGSHNATSLLAVPNASLGASSAAGPISFSSGLKHKPTLRGFAFSGGPTAEFIYPKKDAVTLATANGIPVIAVDPASQGMSSLPHLSPGDMSEVTLWMLTPSPVQPGDAKPGIQAAHYAPPAPAPTASAVAQASVPAPVTAPAAPPAPAPATVAESAPAPTASPAPVYQTDNRPAPPSDSTQLAANVAPSRVHSRARELPQTASDLPLLEMLGSLSLLSALFLRARNFGARRA